MSEREDDLAVLHGRLDELQGQLSGAQERLSEAEEDIVWKVGTAPEEDLQEYYDAYDDAVARLVTLEAEIADVEVSIADLESADDEDDEVNFEEIDD